MRITLAIMLGVAALLVPGTASAAPPANDAFASSANVDVFSLPVVNSVSVVEATVEPGEIAFCGASNTVWYVITPVTDLVLSVDPSGTSFFGAVLNGYRQDGAGLSGLTHLGCATFGSRLTLNVQAGSTYYVQAGSGCCGSGTLQLTFSAVPPPVNDDFADATVVGGLPFSDLQDTTAGTAEAGEPAPSCGQATGSIWYRYTAPGDGWVSASSFGSSVSPVVAAYTGGALGSLAEVGCRAFSSRLTLAVQAGETYMFLVGGMFGGRGNLAFQLQVAPEPVASFGRSIFDPSVYDTIQLFSFAFDPGDVGIESYEWDFGDGEGAAGPSPTHRYGADDTYTITLTVRTFDGRTGSTSQNVEVRTHDVAITKLQTPQSALAGQTKTITVGVSNRRYPETVRVDLYRSGPSGYVLVGSLTQSAPIRSGGRTTDFRINYTFSGEDASIGKVTLRAVATIVGARDALPADNEAIGSPTKVTR